MATPTPKLGSFKPSMFDHSFRKSMLEGFSRRSTMFDSSFRQTLTRDRLPPYAATGYAPLCDDCNAPAPFCSYRYFFDKIMGFVEKLKDNFATAWKIGISDPRKIIFSAKLGLALTLISILIFFKVPGSELSNHYLWAILTVVVVFEFSIGATFSKGCNRGLGTLCAGFLALGMSSLSQKCGSWTEVINAVSIFIVAFVATYWKLYPTMKPYEYGFRVFLLTYCYVTVSGYSTGEFMDTAVSRFLLIALGATVCLVVNTCIYPIWAGEELHNLVAKNFINVAISLEGCVNGYLDCLAYDRIPSQILVYQAVSDDPVYSGYRSAVQSTSQEDTLMGFAAWEPPHGPYRSFRYPWAKYVKVGGALRHCAFMVMALHGCILSEIQARDDKRIIFRDEIQRVGIEGAKVLREIGNKLKKMERINPIEDILYEVHQAAEELQNKIDKKSYVFVNAENWEIGDGHRESSSDEQKIKNLNEDLTRILAHKSRSETILRPPMNWDDITPNNLNSDTIQQLSRPLLQKQPSWPGRASMRGDSMGLTLRPSEMFENASALSLATFTSLLIEFVARLDNVVNAYDELSERADFKDAVMEQTTRTLE